MTVVPAGQAAVLAALVRRYAEHGRATVRQVARDVDRSPGYVWYALCALREQGIVTWDTGKLATLRPTVAVGTPEMARLSADRDYAEERRADLRQQDDPSSTSDPRTQESNGQ